MFYSAERGQVERKIIVSRFGLPIFRRKATLIYPIFSPDPRFSSACAPTQLTFFQRRLLVLLQPLDRDGLEPHPGGGVVLEDVPHVLLAEDEEVAVAHRAHAGCAAVTCKTLAILQLFVILYCFALRFRETIIGDQCLYCTSISAVFTGPFLLSQRALCSSTLLPWPMLLVIMNKS